MDDSEVGRKDKDRDTGKDHEKNSCKYALNFEKWEKKTLTNPCLSFWKAYN